jgi:hypothetical protein
MSIQVVTEAARLRAVYSKQSLPLEDLLNAIFSVMRIEESFTTKFTSRNVAGPATLLANDITGTTSLVVLLNTNAASGTVTTRTAAEMIVDNASGVATISYLLRIINTGAGAFTLAAGAGVTLSGTMTVLVNTFRDFVVTLNGSASTATITTIGTGTYS